MHRTFPLGHFHWSRFPLIVLITLLALVSAPAAQSDGNSRMSVTVSFGAGLNTPPTSAANHHVLPKTIEIKAGGVVNFAVAGFHQIYVYDPGIKVDDIIVPASGLFINRKVDLYYEGLVPAGGPVPPLSEPLPLTTNPSNASNRLESVSFSEPGLYLVICNVRVHFNNGMYAWVKVSR